MKKYKQFLSWVYAMLASCLSASVGLGKDWLTKQIPNNDIFVIVLIVVFALIFFRLLSLFFDVLFKKSKIMRKLIMGKDYIEGYWIDSVYNKEHKLIGGGLVHIYIENGEVIVEGTSYVRNDVKLKPLASFISTMTSYNSLALEFTYKYRDTEMHHHLPKYAQYEFVRVGSKVPAGYTGFFFGSNDGERFHVEAQRITSKQQLSRIKVPKERATIVNEFLREIENGLVIEE